MTPPTAKFIDLVRHYDQRKSSFGPLSPSLSPKLVQLMDIFGQLPASSNGQEFESVAINAWAGCKPGTVKRVLSQVRAVMMVAERDGLIQMAPHISMPYVFDVRDVEISTSEAKLLLDHIQWAEPEWYPLALLLMHAGPRLGEALRVRTNIDMSSSDGVRFRTAAVGRRTKTRTRTVPPTPRLSLAISAGAYAGGVVPARYASASVSAMMGRVLSDACAGLGLPHIRVHDLRHIFAAIVADRGGDIADIASLLGHTNVQQAMRYRGLVKTRATTILGSVTT